MRSLQIRHHLLGRLEIPRMPDTKEQSRRKGGLVIRVGLDRFVHQSEETFRVIVYLDVYVEDNMGIFGSTEEIEGLTESGDVLMGCFLGEECGYIVRIGFGID